MHVLIIGYGNMGKNHGKTLSELGVHWSWYDPYIEKKEFSLDGITHVIIATPILSHYKVYKTLDGFKGRILIEKPMIVSRNHFEIFSDSRVFPGLLERFNPAVVKLKEVFPNDIVNITFTRLVGYATDNLFLEIGIHDLDLLLMLFDVTNLDRVKICDFGAGKKTEYYLSLILDEKVNCKFSWMVSEEKTRSIECSGVDTLYVDLCNQKVFYNNLLLDVTYQKPLGLELHHFLYSMDLIDSKLSHELMLRVLDQ